MLKRLATVAILQDRRESAKGLECFPSKEERPSIEQVIRLLYRSHSPVACLATASDSLEGTSSQEKSQAIPKIDGASNDGNLNFSSASTSRITRIVWRLRLYEDLRLKTLQLRNITVLMTRNISAVDFLPLSRTAMPFNDDDTKARLGDNEANNSPTEASHVLRNSLARVQMARVSYGR
uniref:Uncharacterized protein n=1 Tax=Vespula pensylvanica TaxID=30213 RepID=A0A834KIS0_VESPE|nr:hypothetical protein H0235_014333 [Vespula pensylvanica]